MDNKIYFIISLASLEIFNVNSFFLRSPEKTKNAYDLFCYLKTIAMKRKIITAIRFYVFRRSKSIYFLVPDPADSGPTALRQLGPHRGDAQRLGRAENLEPEPDPDLHSRPHRDSHHQIHIILRTSCHIQLTTQVTALCHPFLVQFSKDESFLRSLKIQLVRFSQDQDLNLIASRVGRKVL